MYIIPSIFIIINSYGIYRMFENDKKIKFESYVLLSGVVESVLFIIGKASEKDCLMEIIEFCQIIITLFVARRFLKIYLILNKKRVDTKLYN